MAPTRTVKNKHAGGKSAGGSSSKGGGKRSDTDGVSKTRSSKGGAPKKAPLSQQVKEKNPAHLAKKHKRRKYTEEELAIPKLNKITPVGVIKPSGKKKGKVFVDDPESMNTILSIVQAEKDGHIESKMIKARKMEEIREARKVEADKKDSERKSKIDDVKAGLRKKRKRKSDGPEESVSSTAATSTRSTRTKKKVAFA